MLFVLLLLCIFLIDVPIVLGSELNQRLRIADDTNNPIVSDNSPRKNGWDNWEETSGESPQPGTSVCYPIVGCFDNNPPFDNAGLNVPQDPSVISTQFLLFTKDTPTNPEVLEYKNNDKSITNSRFNNSNWLRIIVHGFTNNRNSLWIPRLTEELLKLKDNEASDVIVVDWGNGAKFPLYNNAAANTRLVGKEISLILKKMKTLKQLSYDKVHCIGHSLGAHTCGYASSEISRQMARISGLDPAGPFFEGKDVNVRLDQKDAKFVDVIHSNTDIALGVGLGSSDPSGHVDFYVNGGKQQPGCPSVGTMIGGLFGGQSESGFEQSSCSHSRAHGYFIESINSACPYTAFPCQDFDSFRRGECVMCPASGCGRMGFHSIYSSGRGNMYLTTKTSSPFCGYHYFVELSLERSAAKTVGEIYVAIYSNYELMANVSLTGKANAEIKPGDVFRYVFSFNADLGKVDYTIVYFNKGKTLFNLGGPFANEIVISRLRLQAVENTAKFSAGCEGNIRVPAFTSQTMLFNGLDCGN